MIIDKSPANAGTYLVLRPMTPDDAVALWTACWATLPLDAVQERLIRTQSMMNQRRALGIVAVSDGDVIAYGQITLWPHTAEISDLIVTELWRSKGIGTLLIHRLIEAARDWQMPLVEIGVALDNPRALALYQRLGFREARRIDLDLGSGPQVVMYLTQTLTLPK